MVGVEFVLFALLVVVVFIAFAAIAWLGYELFKSNKRLNRFKGIIDLESEQAKVRGVNEKLRSEQARLKDEEKRVRDAIAEVRSQLTSIEVELDIQSHGLYEPKYDFGSSEQYKLKIDEIRNRQKKMIQEKTAIVCGTEWTVGGSKKEGRKMVGEQTKLMLRAFNGECDSLVLKVKYNNIQSSEGRIYSVYEAINKLGKTQNCWINQDYLKLKLEELHLVYGYQEKLYLEREEQRAIREQMRDEEIARREIEKAQQEAEKDEQRYQQALEQARKEIGQVTGAKHDKLQKEIDLLQERLREAQEQKERAISRAQMTRSGYVYIISNIGSFGENTYKIGMTRRLVPEERIQELGDASVPFPFDIHAMIFCEDAPGLETKLHNHFAGRRVNRINLRKEFFNVNLDEIKRIVAESNGEVEFTMLAQAEEYRKTQAIVAEENGHTPEVIKQLAPTPGYLN